jgi:hypothetical protein
MANAVEPATDVASVAGEALLSRRRFLELYAAGLAGPSLLWLAGCGGSQDGGGGGNKKKKKDGGGGGGGGY